MKYIEKVYLFFEGEWILCLRLPEFALDFQELREKNWKAMEALEKAEKNSSDKAVKSARVNICSFDILAISLVH